MASIIRRGKKLDNFVEQLSMEELVAMHILITSAAREYAEDSLRNDPINKIINFFKRLFGKLSLVVVIFLFASVLSASAVENNRHSSVYMDVTVQSVDNGRVVFINNVGDVFNFTDVTKPFKVGDATTLEFLVDFSGDTFVVIDAFYVTQDTRFTYPNNNPDEWKMFVALGILILVVLFGGYLLGATNNQNRKIRR